MMNPIPPELLNRILVGDSQRLAKRIPDNSIRTIFTDPPYPEEYLHLYGWVAKEAARVLTHGSLCLVMAGDYYLPAIHGLISQYLNWHWGFKLLLPGNAANIYPRHISCHAKHILSYCKGTYDGRHVFGTDTITSPAPNKNYHTWGQSEYSAKWFISRLGGPVWEPFTGGGTVPAVCKQLGVDFVAFEIDPETAKVAQERLEKTQPPLLVLEKQLSWLE